MRAEEAVARVCDGAADTSPPKVVFIAAHPDDETIGAGARIIRLVSSCAVIHVTDGAPGDRRFFPTSVASLSRPAYARLRREEGLRALALAGLAANRVIALGVHDQEASFEMVRIAENISAWMARLRAEVVVTHAYEGGHPDHDATAFAVHAAAAMAGSEVAPPPIVEMTSYHDQGGATVRGEFLPRPGVRERTVTLVEDEQRRKRAMLAAYSSQREVLAPFHCEVERFRLAPRYRFDRAPHEGRLHYERFGFGVSGLMWRALARSAAKALGVGEGPL